VNSQKCYCHKTACEETCEADVIKDTKGCTNRSFSRRADVSNE